MTLGSKGIGGGSNRRMDGTGTMRAGSLRSTTAICPLGDARCDTASLPCDRQGCQPWNRSPGGRHSMENQGVRHIFSIVRLLAANAKWPKNEPDPKA